MDKRSAFFGAGVGIIVVTFVFFIGMKLTDQPQDEAQIVEEFLTNDEIIERARVLGMVMVRELPEESLTDSQKKSLTDEEIIERAKQLGFVHRDEIFNSESLMEESSNENPESENEPENKIGDETNNEKEIEKFANIVIPFGSSTTTIAYILFQNEVIDNVDAFIKYVKDNGLSTRLYAGTYRLPIGVDFNEITIWLTGGRD